MVKALRDSHLVGEALCEIPPAGTNEEWIGWRGRNFVIEANVDRNELSSRISIDPNICHGKPCIRGHRIWVSLILDFLADGRMVEEVLEEYPTLVGEDVLACIAYGAETASERFVELDLESV